MNRVTDVSEGLLISFHISGLKPAIQRELLVSKPTSIGDAFSLARVTKAQLDDQITLTTSSRLGVLVLSNYRERLVGTMHVLIDNGNTHNFIRPDVVEKCVCPYNQPSLSKCISGVGKRCCVRVFSHWSSMQGLTMEVDIYVLPMKGPDVVFGIQWLQKFRKATHDCAQHTIEFSLANTTYSLKGDESLRMKWISLHHMQALLEAYDVYGVYEVYSFSMVTKGIITSLKVTESTSPEIEQLLDRFIKVYPYRYPYYQKSEMEKLVKGMMEQGKEVEMDPKKAAAVIEWHNKAFQDLKARLSEAPILGLLNFEDMFIVEVDASDVIQTPLQQKYMRKLMGFYFSIEYKIGATNLVADALSRVYDEVDDVIAEFMALSQPLVSLVNDLRKENETLDELKVIHQKPGRKKALDGFWHEHGIILFRDRYFIGAESKLKELLLSEFHNTSMAGHSGVKKILTKYSMQAPTGLLQPLPTPSGVWEEVSMDFITGLLAVYGRLPPSIIPYPFGSTTVVVVEDLLMEWKVAYRIALPESSKIHPVFHVSLLKFFSGTGQGVVTKLPEEEYEGHPVEKPLAICNSRVVLHRGLSTRQVLVQWMGSSPEEETWECCGGGAVVVVNMKNYEQVERSPKDTVVVPLTYHVNGHYIEFRWEEFCLITGLRFSLEFSERYEVGLISFRRLLFDSDTDCGHITGKMLVDNNNGEEFDNLHDEEIYPWGSLVWAQLYDQLENANEVRAEKLYAAQNGLIPCPAKYTLSDFTWAFMGQTKPKPVEVREHYGLSDFDFSVLQNTEGLRQDGPKTFTKQTSNSFFDMAQRTPTYPKTFEEPIPSRHPNSYPDTPHIATPMELQGFPPWSSTNQARPSRNPGTPHISTPMAQQGVAPWSSTNQAGPSQNPDVGGVNLDEMRRGKRETFPSISIVRWS
nr:hypothetical protein [Tanacetum cinerariifolium]